MSLIVLPFEDYYNELISRPYTIDEALLDVQRGETCARERIQEDADADFADMLHIAGVWIGDKKYYQSGNVPWMSRHALVLYKKQREVWFPATLPISVQPGKRQGFPHTAFRKLCEEENEIRIWFHCIEDKLRERLAKASTESFYLLVCFDQLYAKEAQGETRIHREELEERTALRKRYFLTAPPDFFRQLVIQRYGVTNPRRTIVDRELTFDEMEAEDRDLIEQEEFRSRSELFKILHEAYQTQLFIVNHLEVVARQLIVDLAQEVMYPVLAECCRESFSYTFYHIPATFLHVFPQNRFAVFQELCLERADQITERAKIPVFPEYELPLKITEPSTEESSINELEVPLETEKPIVDVVQDESSNAQRKESGEVSSIYTVNEPTSGRGKHSLHTVRFSCEDDVDEPPQERPSLSHSEHSTKNLEFLSQGSDRISSMKAFESSPRHEK
ncbi:unnamed protein product [Phytomonas sp. Hart1]|nr:unnamed protein product [Phytomonas sp. Hart1]|eukprot:CCW70673.1 unnamed protein product [Phytomonas sp. isolate Hart1]